MTKQEMLIKRLQEENAMLKEQIKDLSDRLSVGGENMPGSLVAPDIWKLEKH